MGKTGPGSNGNELELHTPQISRTDLHLMQSLVIFGGYSQYVPFARHITLMGKNNQAF